jgi:hypothetical protein
MTTRTWVRALFLLAFVAACGGQELEATPAEEELAATEQGLSGVFTLDYPYCSECATLRNRAEDQCRVMGRIGVAGGHYNCWHQQCQRYSKITFRCWR